MDESMEILRAPKLLLVPVFLCLLFLFFDIFPQPINSFYLKIKNLSQFQVPSVYAPFSFSVNIFRSLFLLLCFLLTLQTTVVIFLLTSSKRNYVYLLYNISTLTLLAIPFSNSSWVSGLLTFPVFQILLSLPDVFLTGSIKHSDLKDDHTWYQIELDSRTANDVCQ